ncbi:MAG: UDP-N-acetyl-D-mannosaminuronic acid dehydrogenase [Clostridiaceae bacterium BRH_c20a]|nr:MAG: UDP-N-acetyl-D-mannosaminuronic acid dehydrogenase [Clostridiaceae bacterium BRH_c20a]
MINLIGLGYIGLPTALMFAKAGNKVIGTDCNTKIVETLSNGECTFEEIGLREVFKQALENSIEFRTEYVKAKTYVITVPTPYISNSKKIDPKFVLTAFNSVLNVCEKGSIIIIESTVSPGFIDKYIRPEVVKKNLVIGKDIHLVHAPERIIPGNIIFELENNSRTIGVDSQEVGEIVKKLYSSFCKAEIVITDIKSAEMSKVVENTYRDINIAFANELAKICREDNMDVYEIIRIANMHPRVNILKPGPGVGGHCISVDPWFLVGDYPDLTNLILSARKVNDSMPSFVLGRIKEIMKLNQMIDPLRVGLYGLTYKENVDDTRESPTLQLLSIMNNHLASGLKVYDPFVKQVLVDTQILDFDGFLNEIDILVILVGHKHLLDNIEKIKTKIVLDTRNIVNDVEKLYKL